MNTVPRVDYDAAPPRIVGDGWRVLVPEVNAEGNDEAGIALWALRERPGAYLGWNVRKEGLAKGELCFLFGGHRPLEGGDRARERFLPDLSGLGRARAMKEDGFLLSEDFEALAAARGTPTPR